MTPKEKIIKKIIEQIETGTVPWHQPWFNIGKRNFQSGHFYRGVNRMLLAGSPDIFYLTFKQACSLGGHIKKGEKGWQVVFWQFFDDIKMEDEETGEIIYKKRPPYCRTYVVFGLSQIVFSDQKRIDKLMEKYNPKKKENINVLEDMKVEDFLKKTKADIRHTDKSRAFYSPYLDYINVPSIRQFNSKDEYYSTTFHELIHWTGHESRCNRGLKADTFGSDGYGKEELVAEIGASFLNNEFGFDTLKNSAAYLKGWIQKIKEISNIIFSAASKAEDAINYLKKIVK